MKKLFVFLVTTILLLYFFQNSIQAQGTYTCWWDADNDLCENPTVACITNPGAAGCEIYNLNCEAGYIPEMICGNFDDTSETECEEARVCVELGNIATTTPAIPTSTPQPTNTPNPGIGTYGCEWDPGQDPECTIDNELITCNIDGGWIPCESNCEARTTQAECEATVDSPIWCVEPGDCFALPTPEGRREAQCAVDPNTGLITNYCEEDNPYCDEEIYLDEDGNPACRCVVPGYPGETCWVLGNWQFTRGLAIWCDLAGNPVNEDDINWTNRLYTAIGCIPIGNGTEFTGFVLQWSIGIAGGIALLLIVYAGIQILTAAGDPKKVQSGKELLTAAIAGILFLILSVYIIRLFGVEILQIPGL